MRTNGTVPSRAELESAGMRIVVGVPMERTVPGGVFGHFWQIAARGWSLLDTGYGRTDVQRNHFATALLQSDYTHLMMLDLDHFHPPDIIERLAWRMIEQPDRQIVAGLNFRRGAPFDPLAFRFGQAGAMYPLSDWAPNACTEVHAMGHGAILIRRDVFEQLDRPYWAYDYGQADSGIWPSEDMYFCYLCREAGIHLWVDTGVISPHLIDNVVTEAVFRSYQQHRERA